jgi:hypothetical protein
MSTTTISGPTWRECAQSTGGYPSAIRRPGPHDETGLGREVVLGRCRLVIPALDRALVHRQPGRGRVRRVVGAVDPRGRPSSVLDEPPVRESASNAPATSSAPVCGPSIPSESLSRRPTAIRCVVRVAGERSMQSEPGAREGAERSVSRHHGSDRVERRHGPRPRREA